MKTRSIYTIAGMTAAGAAAYLAYKNYVRPWHLRWGATDEELTEALPGDDVKADAGVQITHAITIDAPPDAVWRWLVQIGQNRGGFFSYDWLENAIGLGIHTSTELVPEFQELKEGDLVRGARVGWMGGRFDDVAGWTVAEIRPNRALVLRDIVDQGSWSFILRPIENERTRLIIRARGSSPKTPAMKLFHYALLEPSHFIMERKMLMTLKELAEKSREHEEALYEPQPSARYVVG